MLPIKRVTLFKHGVGYYERSGKVENNQDIVLNFKKDQMNDVLKSLTALDYDGGTFASMGYDSEAPLAKRMSELNLTIPDNKAISKFLDHVKGTRVSLTKANVAIEGVIMGIDEVNRVFEGQLFVEAHLAVLTDGKRLARIPLLEIEDLQFLDEDMSKDLTLLLDLLHSGLRKEQKRIVIHARGGGMRNVSISYVIEAPEWKTTYRIVLPGQSSEKPLLQGWAIVDNTTDEDWKAVTLSLVAGLPISFIHDLYTPRYLLRPEVRVNKKIDTKLDILLSESRDDVDIVTEVGYRNGLKANQIAAHKSMLRAAGSSVEVYMHTHEVGDLFAYEIKGPVDVNRGSSALVPIVQTEGDFERVALYNAEIRDGNPMTAIRFKNSTGLLLEGGPVTVFEEGQYVGEAMLDRMQKKEERIVPYSVELGIKVMNNAHYETKKVTMVSKSGLKINKHYNKVKVTTYEIFSCLDRDVTLFLDHPCEYLTLHDTKKPEEKTERIWRFKLNVPGNKTTKFKVGELNHEYESINILGIAYEEISHLVSDNLISKTVKEHLEYIADKAKKINELEKEIKKRQNELTKINQGQERVRNNLKVLGNNTEENELRMKYVATLSAEEDRIETLHAEIETMKEECELMRIALNQNIEEMNF